MVGVKGGFEGGAMGGAEGKTAGGAVGKSVGETLGRQYYWVRSTNEYAWGRNGLPPWQLLALFGSVPSTNCCVPGRAPAGTAADVIGRGTGRCERAVPSLPCCRCVLSIAKMAGGVCCFITDWRARGITTIVG